MHVLEPVGDNLVAVGQIILDGPSVSFLLVLGNTGGDVPFGQPLPRHRPVDLDEPSLVHEGGGVNPGFLVEGDVVAFKDDDAVGGLDGDVVLDGVLFGVVKGRGVNCFCFCPGVVRVREDQGFLLAEGAEEGIKRRAVKGEFGAAAGVGGGRVGQGGEVGAGEVVAVHGDEGGYWRWGVAG